MRETTFFITLFIITFIVSLIFIFRYEKKKSDFDWENIIISFLLTIFSSLIITFVFGATIIGIYSLNVDKHEEENHYLYISSINRNSEISGSFFLGTGSVDEKNYYYFYYKSRYGYKLDKITVKNSYIVETKHKKPEIVKVVDTYNQDVFIKLLDSNVKRYLIYVPENTIIKDFKLR